MESLLAQFMQNYAVTKIGSKKVSSYKKCIDTLEQAPGSAGSRGGAGLEHVMYQLVLRTGSAQPRED